MIPLNQLHDAFADNFATHGELGAAFCLWSDQGPVVSLAGGTLTKDDHAGPWRENTLVPVWSTTKGPAAATLLLCLDRAGLSLDTDVRHVWPRLAGPLTFGQLLSHQSGLPALDLDTSVFDHDAAVTALEQQPAAWRPGTAHGYHPRTFGPLLDECVRRLSGAPLGLIWRREIAEPLDLEIWIGLPEREHPRVATVYPGPFTSKPGEEGFTRAFSNPASLTRRSFASLRGLQSIAEMNQPPARLLASPAFSGIASARGLARFYHALATGDGGLFSPRLRHWAETPLVNGPDRVLLLPTSFSAGFQKDPVGPASVKLRDHYGHSPRAFGHPGAGGSLAWADPERRLGGAYVMNLIAPGVLPSQRTLALVHASSHP